MRKIYVGKIINTFGIKGELKVSSLFQYPEKVFIKNKKIIIEDKEIILNSVRLHKNNYLIKLKNIHEINEALQFKNSSIYIYRKDLILNKNEILYDDLIDFMVFDNNELVGKVTSYYLGINPLLKINDSFYIPLKGNFINEIDFKKEKIICRDLKGLIL